MLDETKKYFYAALLKMGLEEAAKISKEKASDDEIKARLEELALDMTRFDTNALCREIGLLNNVQIDKTAEASSILKKG